MSGIADSAAGTAIGGAVRGASNVAAISLDQKAAIGNYSDDLLASQRVASTQTDSGSNAIKVRYR